MESVQLEVSDRTATGTAACRRMRNSGIVPINLYGKGRDSRALQAKTHDIEMLIERGNHIVELTLGSDSQVALVKDVQFDAIGSNIQHADLMRIDRDKPVQVYVPVRFIGVAPEVSGSNLEKNLEDIHVECLPLTIPNEFVVNLSGIEVGTHFTIAELEAVENVKILHEDSDIVVNNHAMVMSSEPEDGEEGDDSVEPEVIGKGGSDDDDDA